ncbi:MAG: hypothetical protein ACJ8AG_05180, partial [Ktedonobacteraceae bacterium]
LLRSAVIDSFRSPMCYPPKGDVTGRVWSLSPFPRHPSINVDPPRAPHNHRWASPDARALTLGTDCVQHLTV